MYTAKKLIIITGIIAIYSVATAYNNVRYTIGAICLVFCIGSYASELPPRELSFYIELVPLIKESYKLLIELAFVYLSDLDRVVVEHFTAESGLTPLDSEILVRYLKDQAPVEYKMLMERYGLSG